MKTGLYATADLIAAKTGGGAVTYHELRALQQSTGGSVHVLSRAEVAPFMAKLPDTPFLWDYVTAGYLGQLDLTLTAAYLGQLDLTLAHFYSGCFTNTICLLRAKGIPVTYTAAAHDRRLSIEEFNRLGLDYPFPHIADDTLWQLYLGGYRASDIVVTPSELSRELMASYGARNVVVIPHGCDIPAEVPPFPQKFTVGYLGNVGPDKGVVYLLRAWAMLAMPDAELIIAGPNTSSLRPMLETTRARNVTLLGFVESIDDFYKRCSVYVQPSVSEGFGLEVLEAMARGRPVVVSRGAGAADAVLEETGFIVGIRNPHEIAETIQLLAKHEGLLRTMGAKARERAKEFTWERIEEQYKELWRGLVGLPVAIHGGTESPRAGGR